MFKQKMSYESYVTKCRDIISYADTNPMFNAKAVQSMLTNSEKYSSFTPKQQSAIDNVIDKWKIPTAPAAHTRMGEVVERAGARVATRTFKVAEKDYNDVLLFLLEKGIKRYKTI